MSGHDFLQEACAPGSFASRHIGPDANEASEIAKLIGYDSVDSLIDDVVPASIRLGQSLDLPEARSEAGALRHLEDIMGNNRICRSLIGCGYSDCFIPAVIQRNILENPGWYTAYTPYQAEIAQGRMEALITFQTMVKDLTAMDIANASLLDEGSAAAEAMAMCAGARRKGERFLVSKNCHPQTIDVLRTRAEPLGISIDLVDEKKIDLIVLDLPEPWKAIDAARKSLKVGGFLVSYSPSIPQTTDFVNDINKDKDFVHVKTSEIIERNWEIDGRKVRPRSQQIGHSGFISFVRRI